MSEGIVITRCAQAGARVEVFGRFPAEGPERERLLFSLTGVLVRFSADAVVITGTSGLEEEYGPDGREKDDGADLIASLRDGNPRAIWQVFFLAAVLLFAWATGTLDL